MNRFIILTALMVFPVVMLYGQKNFTITANSVAGIKLGMTVSQAKRQAKRCRFKRASDGEGVALIGMTCAGKQIVTMYAGEDNVDAPIDMNARIELIEVWDRRFKTKDGVHKGMLIRDVEKRLGKVIEIILTQTESREFATFKKQRKGISYRFYGGIYPPGITKTTRYERGARLWSIQVSRY